MNPVDQVLPGRVVNANATLVALGLLALAQRLGGWDLGVPADYEAAAIAAGAVALANVDWLTPWRTGKRLVASGSPEAPGAVEPEDRDER